jgi:hypothetical protein
MDQTGNPSDEDAPIRGRKGLSGEPLADSDKDITTLVELSEDEDDNNLDLASVSEVTSSTNKKKAKTDMADAITILGESMKQGMMAMAARPVENSSSDNNNKEILNELRAMNSSQVIMNEAFLKALQNLSKKDY